MKPQIVKDGFFYTKEELLNELMQAWVAGWVCGEMESTDNEKRKYAEERLRNISRGDE